MDMHRGRLLVALLLPLLLAVAVACGGESVKGAPSKNGEYTVKPGSITYDGDRYRLLWEDGSGQFKELNGKGLKMVKGEQTRLVRDGDGTVLHLREDEPVQVLGRDNDGNYNSPWFPFFLGATIGNSFGRPGYHYPPTDTFGRGDQLNGSVVQSKAQAPKYEGLAPNPNAVSGQNQGTGGGNAVTNKAGGGDVTGAAAGGAAAGAAVSGQAAGTGSGTAASAKGGFQKGTSSYENRVKRTSSGSGVSSSSGSNSNQNAAPKNSKPSAPKPKAPSRGGGRSGGK
jgi:hypothetical protein